MISLKKLDKPTILCEKEEIWKKELMDHYYKENNILKTANKKYGHSEIKSILIQETNHKCAYCESKITAIDHGDIEHIEPKSKVPIRTFDWDNLTLSCRKCNQNKGAYYNPEKPLLNPYLDDIGKEIVFLGPIISARTDRAQLTVKLLKLDRVELFERRTNYINNIQPLIDLFVQTDDEIMKELTYQDILEYTENKNEYSAMMKSVVSTINSPTIENVS
ncbi:HNH endonuclease [Bacillus sp. ISL-53]|nr:HNH endonuclease [Bacillus sp. ISL-53]